MHYSLLLAVALLFTNTPATQAQLSQPMPASQANQVRVKPRSGPQLTPVLPQSGARAAGGFQFNLSAEPDTTYIIQASADLVHWSPVGTNQSSFDGQITFTDAGSAQWKQRFYRAQASLISLGNFRQDRILVKPLPGIDLTALHTLLGTKVLRSFPAIGNLEIVQLPVLGNVWTYINTFRASGLVAYAEPDVILTMLATPNDFRFWDGSLWNFQNTGQLGGTPGADIDATAGWDIRTSANDIIVAVIDTGIHASHEDLGPNLWVNPREVGGNGVDDDGNGFIDDVHGINTLTGTGDPDDDYGHGTHVSGIIGAVGNNTVGVVGVAWQVKLMECKFIDAQGNGAASDAITCIDYARANGANIINASWGTTDFNTLALHDAFASARDAGIIVAAACGNSENDNDAGNAIYPASFDLDNIIAVAATDRNDNLAFFSSYGATTVDLGAPGEDVFSCWNSSDSAYQAFSGTSMAAAHVSGVCALVRAQYPQETYSQIIHRVLSGVDPLPSLLGKCTTGGRLNLFKALGATPPPVPTVTVAATDATAAEGGTDTGTFTVSRAGSTAAPLTVSYSLGGTASNGSDYQSLPGSVTIAPGSTTATITVTPIDDSTIETNETVVLTLSANAAYNIGSPSSATVTIVDNDQTTPPDQPVVSLSALDPNASETGPDIGVIRFHRTGDVSQPLTVNWTFSGTAVNGSDYQQLPTTGFIPAGQSDADLTITPIDDSEVEGNETVVVTLAVGTGYTIGSNSTATVTIADNDQPPPQPTVTVAATDATASESGGDTGTFTVTRTGSTASALTVTYSLGGTASNGSDYQSLPGSVTIPAGASAANITVTPIDDSTVETNETVVLTVSANAAYLVGSPGNATVTITDNDQTAPPKPTVTVLAVDLVASEPGTDTGAFRIVRSVSSPTPLTVNYTLGGTAQNGTDYQRLSGSVTIPAGATSVDVIIQPIDDHLIEVAELVILSVAPNSNYNVGLLSTATVTILDNDL